MLLSIVTSAPRSLRTAGHRPFDDALVQPSSVDVRLDNLFRFNNTRYTHIDPAKR